MKKQISLALALVFIWTCVFPVAASAAEYLEPLKVHNSVVEYTVNKDNSRFTIKTTDGIPNKSTDNDKNLLFVDKVPDTSFTTFKIDGKDYIFGNEYELGTKGGTKALPSVDGTVTKTVWEADGVEITQRLQLLSDVTNPNVGNVRITYQVKNVSSKSKEVGSRILLDTMMGSNDASAVVVNNTYVTNEKLLIGQDMPTNWKSADQQFAPNVVAYGLTKGWGNLEPDKMIIAHWEGISNTKWDYEPNERVNFSTDKNSYESADSAVAYYWEPKRLGAGEEVIYETYYGLGSLKDTYADAKFGVQVNSPEKLTINDQYTGYNEKEIEIVVNIDNNLADSQPLTNVEVELNTTPQLKLADDQRKVMLIKSIPVGEVGTAKFKVIPEEQKSLFVAQCGITIRENENETERMKYIILPSIKGTPPKMQMTGISPETFYYKSNNKKLAVKGSDFYSLKADTDWTCYIENEDTGKKYPINQGDVYIEDKTLTIIIGDNFDFEVGNHNIVIETKNFGTMKKSIEMSSDKRYDRKEYGVLIIGNTAPKDEKPIYEIAVVATEEELETNTKINPLLTIRGAIVSYELDGVMIYEAAPGSIINSAIMYKSYSFSPNKGFTVKKITETKKNPITGRVDTTDLVKVEGDGLLAVGDYTFHSGKFSVELEDETPYTIDREEAEEEGKERVTIKTTNSGGIFQDVGDETANDILGSNDTSITQEVSKWTKFLGFQIQVNDAMICEDAVSLGGSLTMKMPSWAKKKSKDEPEDTSKLSKEEKEAKAKFDKNSDNLEKIEDGAGLEINLEELRYAIQNDNTSYLKGFVADGTAGIDDSLISNLKFELEGALELNSLDYPGMYSAVAISVNVADAFGADANFGFIVEDSGKSYPDSVGFVFGGDKVRIPLGGIGYLTKLGGGVEGLYKTIKGDFKYVPPVTLYCISGYADPTTYAFLLEDITLKVGGSGVSLVGENGKIFGIPLIEEMGAHVLAYDTDLGPAIDMGASIRINLLDCLIGEGAVWFIYDPTLKGFFGPVSMGGKAYIGVFIPSFIPLIGGLELLSVYGEVSTYRVFAGITIIGIPISVGYYWDDKKVKFGDTYKSAFPDNPELIIPKDELDNALSVEYMEGDGDSQGAMVFGGNLRKVSSSKRDSSVRMLSLASTASTVHSMEILNQDYALMEFSYTEDIPNIALKDPNGNNYELVEGANYMTQTIPASESISGLEEKRVYISITDPIDGTWNVVSDKPVDYTLMDVLPLPEIKNIETEKINNNVTVTWDANAIDENYTVDLYMSEHTEKPAALANVKAEKENFGEINKQLAANTELGRIVKSDIKAADGKATFAIPETMNSGNYNVRAVLIKNEKIEAADEIRKENYDSEYSSGYFNYVNPSGPTKPQNVKFALAGDELFKVTYDEIEGADGYIIQVLDEFGNEIPDVSTKVVDNKTTKVLVGGQYYKTTKQDEEGKTIEQELVGVFPDKDYKIAVTSFKKHEGMELRSETVMSEVMHLPISNPAKLELKLDGNELIKGSRMNTREISEDNPSPHYQTIINKKESELTVKSNQDGILMCRVNSNFTGSAVDLKAGEELKIPVKLAEGENLIEIYSKNAAEDYSSPTVTVTVDSTAPQLMLDNTVIRSIDGKYQITGTVENNSRVYINNSKDFINIVNGSFVYEGTQIATKDTVTVKAVDTAGNETVSLVEVIPNELSNFKSIVIKEKSNSKLTRTANKKDKEINVGDELQLELYGIGLDDKEYKQNGDDVTWSIAAGNDKAKISKDGTVTAKYEGDTVVMAEYFVTEGYSFEDTYTVGINTEYIKPESIRISTTDIPKSANIGSVVSILSIPNKPVGVDYEYVLEDYGDSGYFTLDRDTLYSKKKLDKDVYNIKVTALGKHTVNGISMLRGSENVTGQFTLNGVSNIVSVDAVSPVQVENGTEFNSIGLPQTASVTLDDGNKAEYPVNWSVGAYKADIANLYRLSGEIQKPSNVRNNNTVTATMEVRVLENKTTSVGFKFGELKDNKVKVYLDNTGNSDISGKTFTSAQVGLKLKGEGITVKQIKPLNDLILVDTVGDLTSDDGGYVGIRRDETKPLADVPNTLDLFEIEFDGLGSAGLSMINKNGKAHFEGNGVIITPQISYADSAINVSIGQETKDLTFDINLDYAVKERDANYNKMNLSITSGNETRNILIGKDQLTQNGKIMFNNKEYAYTLQAVNDMEIPDVVKKYSVKFTLPQNTKYTLKLTGDGYRTVAKSVLLNENTVVEAKSSGTVADLSPAYLRFIAGEIIADGIINIYDLSAAASYFNPKSNNVEPDKIKYDLNRDNVIDVTDIAYIIRNWGK